MHLDQALRLVYDAIDAVNPQLPASRRLAKAPETVIVGPSGVLDSLGIINFLLALEERASDAAGGAVQLLDDPSTLMDQERFRTVGALARHLEGIGRG
jgi:hypothetical protein